MRQRKIKLPAIATWVERRAQRREVRKRWGKLQIIGVDLGGSDDLCGDSTLQLWRDFRITLPGLDVSLPVRGLHADSCEGAS